MSAQYNLGEKLQLPSLIYTTAKDWEEKGIGTKGVSDSQKWEGKGWGLFVFLHPPPLIFHSNYKSNMTSGINEYDFCTLLAPMRCLHYRLDQVIFVFFMGQDKGKI